ncbi:polyadenylate-binding protein 1-like isoform X2 [Triplophysa rosa]|uniref:polyadenylate-binding protein 1-like isoform X2 n=1 Tax=Triplophysa rosa TaxID=992332 RepID=UPI00254631BF|nr:polyadenylate-binding protein 1-like isoform X2 [Triplophysa rosa]
MRSASARVASLYVGDLHPEVSEVMLYDRFVPFGPIHSTRVCRDRNTFRSLGYGYVNFVNRSDAEHAMEILMFSLLVGQAMRIMWADRNPTLRTTGVGNVIIQGLAKDINSLALHDTFSIYGTILSCKVVADENGSRGYGFVHFESYEAAERAIQELNGMMLNDQPVSISHFRSFQERQAQRESKPDRTKKDYQSLFPGVHLYVNNLPYSWTDHQLHRAFSPFGAVTNATVVRNGGRSRGFGFVCFKSPEAAARAVSAMDGRVIANRRLNVAFSRVLDTPVSVSDCASPPENQSLLPSGHFGIVPQAVSNVGQQLASLIRLVSSCRRDAAGLLPKCESLVPLVSPLLLDSVVPDMQSVNQEVPELTSDASGTSDTLSSPLSGDFGAVVPKTRNSAGQHLFGHLSTCLVSSRRWYADGVLPQCERFLLLVSPLLSDTFDSEPPCMPTGKLEMSEMTPDQATDAPGVSETCGAVAVHDRFGNGLGVTRNMNTSKVGEISSFVMDFTVVDACNLLEIIVVLKSNHTTHLSSSQVMVVMDGAFVSVFCCSSDDTITVIVRIQEDLLLYSERLLVFNTIAGQARRTSEDTSSPRLAIQAVPESDQIVADTVQPSAPFTIKPVLTTLKETWASLHKAGEFL